MSLYTRSFSALKPYWRGLLVASGSAALHALFSGLLVWMIGPLLTTLFDAPSVLPGFSGAAPTQVTTPVDSTWTGAISQVGTSLKDTLQGWISAVVQSDQRSGVLFNFCLMILAIVLLKNIFLYIQGYNMSFVQQAVMRDFRDRLFDKYQRLSLAYFHRQRTGQIMSRVTNDVAVLNESIDLGFNRLVTDALLAIMLFAFLIILSWKLTLLAMIILPLVFAFIWYVGKKLRKYSERSQERMADVNAVLEESINNVRIVKAFSMERFEFRKFTSATQSYFKSLLRMNRLRQLATPINDTLVTLAGIAILLYAGNRIILGTGELDAGDFMTFVFAMFSMIKPVKSLSQIHIKLQEGMAAAHRVFSVLDEPETIIETATAIEVDTFREVIKYEQVSFRYLPDEPLLEDISFAIRKGEVIAVVGPSGAGKSTMFDLLPRFYDPRNGRITIDGRDIRELRLSSLRRMMGIVTQETFLFNDTILNNIAYGMDMDNVSMDKVVAAARAANAHEFIEACPEGYQTPVGNRGTMLSGGQRQRLAIARALLKNPQILIFDEATSSLDTESEAQVQEAIDRLMADRTVLVIAHRLSTIKNADRILVLDAGRIVEAGRHQDLLNINGLYARLYQMQFRD